MPDIDIKALREIRDGENGMADYYAKSDEKLAQNAALVAAGLKPLHSESGLKWDAEMGAKRRRHAAVLDAVIAHFEGEQ